MLRWNELFELFLKKEVLEGKFSNFVLKTKEYDPTIEVENRFVQKCLVKPQK